MSIKTLSLSYEKIFVVSIFVEEANSDLVFRINGILFCDLGEKFNEIFLHIGLDLKINNLNVIFSSDNNYKGIFREEYELPIFLAIFSFFKLFNFDLSRYLCIGKISNEGDFLPSKGVFISSKYILNSNDFCGVVCSKDSFHESCLFSSNVDIISCRNILELMNYFNHKKPVFIDDSRMDFFLPKGGSLVLDNNCVLIGDLVEICEFLKGLIVVAIRDQLFEMLSCINFKQPLCDKYAAVRTVIDFQYCFADFIESLLNCRMSNFNGFEDSLVLNKSLFVGLEIDFFNALFFNDFPIIYLHEFENFPHEETVLVIKFFTHKKFSDFKLIFSANNISDRVKYLDDYGFKLIKVSS